MSGQYDLTLAAGAADKISATGTQLLVQAAPFGAVQVQVDYGDKTTLNEGQGINRTKGFRDVLVKNLAAVAQTISVFVGGDDFVDKRITGTVAVVDSSKSTTLVAAAFVANGSATGGAAQFATVQLWNPAGSAKRYVIESVTANNGAALNAIGIGFNLAQLTGAGTGVTVNKLSGGGASPAALINQKADNATDPRAGLDGVITGQNVAASGQLVFVPKRPLILLANHGLVVASGTPNVQHGAVIEYYEEAG